MVRAQVSRQEAEALPHTVWNAFLRLIAGSEPGSLTPLQMAARLAFFYDAEVQNGGHFQFFENQGVSGAEDTLDALRDVGAPVHREILARALERHRGLSPGGRKARSEEELALEAMLGDYDRFDAAYYESSPDLRSILKGLLDACPDEFIEWTEP